MVGFIIRTVVIAIAVAVVAYFYPAIDYGDNLTTLAVVAVVMGVLNAFVKPVISALSLPLNLATFGLFGLVLNAVMLLVVALITEAFGFSFVIGGFPPDFSLSALVSAFIGAIAISIVSAIIGLVVPD